MVGTRRKNSTTEAILPPAGLVMIVGNYGSGKTEVAVNLALQWVRDGRRVRLADLDIVNPYFRCREARAALEAAGIRVVVPPGAQSFADLPIVVPEIRGMLQPAEDELSLFDVGGDDVGARLLSSLVEPLGKSPYALWQVINGRRPFTDSVAGCLKMRAAIEDASRLRVGGLIANTHLVTETTPEVILEGLRLTRETAAAAGLPVVFVTAMGGLADDPSLAAIPEPLLRLERLMLPPWLQRGQERSNAEQPDAPLPAARPVPLGRRSGVS